MVDLASLKAALDLRLLVEQELGKPVTRGAKAWNFKCPFHQETKGASLTVYKDGWICWGACQERGDALSWIAKRHNLNLQQRVDFKIAVGLLGGEPERSYSYTVPSSSTKQQPAPLIWAEPPSAAWQAAGLEVVEQAERHLWLPAGREALEYLVRQRGLWPDTLQTARLGYMGKPKGGQAAWDIGGLSVPAHSIIIPWFAHGKLWGIKCRRLAGDDPRYKEVSTLPDDPQHLGKSNLGGALYWVDQVLPHYPVLIVEGEFNCLAVWEAAGALIRPVSLGASGRSLNVRWFAYLITASEILAWFDNDKAGQKGLERLLALSPTIHAISLPEGVGKDINDFWIRAKHSGEGSQVMNWLEAALQTKC